MPNLNFLVFLNAYSDANSSNNPSLNNFKWDREIRGLPVNNPQSFPFTLAPGETKTLFNGSRALAQDGSTQYSIALKALTSNTYILSNSGGTAPNFRTPRVPGADATTQITVTLNGPIAIFTSTGGTALSLISGGVVVGDYVRIGNLFNPANQGEFKILSLSATSFTVENELAAAEGPITLGSGFASQLQIYSALGVQVGDTLIISGGFSAVTQGSYKVTSVGAEFLEFYSTDVLPQEGPITTESIAIYSEAKQLVYMESDQNCSMNINGSAAGEIQPIVINNSVQPGVFMRTSVMYSMTVTNNSTDPANLFLASAE
jgi:hypothetical protein